MSTSQKPGPPSDSGSRASRSCGAARRHPSAIASAAWPAESVPAKQSGAMRTRTASSCQHGHSIIATLTGELPSQTTGPLWQAGGRALAIDGGRYAGGPLLLVRLDEEEAGA